MIVENSEWPSGAYSSPTTLPPAFGGALVGGFDLVDDRRELGVAQRRIFLPHHLAAGLGDGRLGDFVAGARIDVVGADEEEALALLARHPLDRRDHRLRGLLRGVEHAL